MSPSPNRLLENKPAHCFAKRFAVFLGAFAMLSFAGTGRAADFYIAQIAQGAGTGADAADAKAVSFFNTSGNWSSPTKVAGKISPGDTVHLCDTISTALTVQAGGTAGNVITVLFEPGAKMSASTWNSQPALNIGNNSYLTVDGGATGTIGGYNGNPARANGIIESTANGTGLANSNDDKGIACIDCSNVTVQGIVFRNLYVHTGGIDDPNRYGCGVTAHWNGSIGPANITCNNCIFHDMATGMGFGYGPSSTNFTMSNCTAYNCNWGGNAGDDGAPTSLNGLSVHDCYFSNWQNWSAPFGDVEANLHHNGFYAWAESGGSLTGVTYYNNYCGPGYDTQSSSGLFISGNAGNILIYNNVLVTDSSSGPDDGLIFVWIHNGNQSGVRIYNNTMVGSAGGGCGINVYAGNGPSLTTYDIKNNLFSGIATGIVRYYNAESLMTADYNVGYNLSPNTPYSDSPTDSSMALNFAQWQADGYDARGSSGNPNLNVSYVPQPTSAAIGKGTNLSSYFTTDAAGSSRPQSPAAWDIGAYEFIAPQAATPTFSPPAGTYTSAQLVTITSTTRGAIIRYTTDGSTPTETNGTPYSGPVSIRATTVLAAIAYETGFIDSPVGSGGYTISPTSTPTPTPSPTPTPTSPTSGGGAPSDWFLGFLAFAGILRWKLRRPQALM